MVMKFNPEMLDGLLERLGTLAPSGAAAAGREELRRLLESLLSAALARMNLVTREEFDAQAALLVRTREKLDRLEAAMNELETGAS